MKLGESVEQEIRQFVNDTNLYHRCFYSLFANGMGSAITREIHSEVEQAIWDFTNANIPNQDFDTLYDDNYEDEDNYEEDEDW